MSILIKTVRISGFRGLENIEVPLEEITILTGMNNTGKTSFLKALQLALGNTQFISNDDFFIGEKNAEKIVIDLLIVPIDDEGKQNEDFSSNWENLFGVDRIKYDDKGNALVPLRTIITLDETSHYSEKFILQGWPAFKQKDKSWFEVDNGSKTSFPFYEEIKFFYMSAQRDILEDTKYKNSYLGKMISGIEYSEEKTEELEKQIEQLNADVVKNSDILSNIKETLEELNTAMDAQQNTGIEITPLTKKLRDLNKGLQIYYSEKKESFSMEYHGMGTRSWSSLLTLKSYISSKVRSAKQNQQQSFPVIAIEEPEAHLHPNAQKKLYGQINSMQGQKIIATHSPYIAASAKLKQIRHFYKNEIVTCGKINTNDFKSEEIRKITRQVINTRGEIFFSKIIVFFEGETEEQALPIFLSKHFNKTSVELGVDFIGVGGHGNYKPFLQFAESLKIPWLIFSDAEPAIKRSVNKQFSNSCSSKRGSDCIIFLDNGNNFEKQLLVDGYNDEIKQAVISVCNYENSEHKKAKVKEIKSYSNDKLYELITDKKTLLSPAIAEKIIKSDKPLPPNVIELFDKLEAILEHRRQKDDK